MRYSTIYFPDVFLDGGHTGGTGHAIDAQEALLKVIVISLEGCILLPSAGDTRLVGWLLFLWMEEKGWEEKLTAI